MTVRALEFSQQQPSDDAGYTAVVARLQRDIDRADQLIMLAGNGDVGEHGAHQTRSELRRAIEQQLRHLVAVAETAAADHPEFHLQFARVRSDIPNRVMLGRAEAMLVSARLAQDVLLANGLGATFVAELQASLDRYSGATADVHNGRINHVGANAELRDVVSDAAAMVGILDGFNRLRFAGDAQRLAAWKSVRKVAGPFRGDVVTDSPGPGAPSTPPADGSDGGRKVA